MNLPSRQRQKGYVLYMALALLIAATILGVAAMRGTTTQEVMVQGYRDMGAAFENTEAQVNVAERAINPDDAALAECIPVNPDTWASAQTAATTEAYRIDPCDGSSSLGMGRSTTSQIDKKYRILSTDFDNPTRRGTQVVIETIYIP